MKKKIAVVIGLIIVVSIFSKYGRTIYIPVMNKIKANETVESRIDKVQEEVSDRLKSHLNLAGYDGRLPK